MITEVAKIFGVDELAILDKTRGVVDLERSIYFWLLHQNGRSYEEIAKLNDRGRVAIYHNVKSINEGLQVNDPQVVNKVNKIKHLIEYGTNKHYSTISATRLNWLCLPKPEAVYRF